MRKYLLFIGILMVCSSSLYANNVMEKAKENAERAVLYSPNDVQELERSMRVLNRDTSVDGVQRRLSIWCRLEWQRVTTNEAIDYYSTRIEKEWENLFKTDKVLQEMAAFHGTKTDVNSLFHGRQIPVPLADLVEMCQSENIVFPVSIIEKKDAELERIFMYGMNYYCYIERVLFGNPTYIIKHMHRQLPDSIEKNIERVVYMQDISADIARVYTQINHLLAFAIANNQTSICAPYAYDILAFCMYYCSLSEMNVTNSMVKEVMVQTYGAESMTRFAKVVNDVSQLLFGATPLADYMEAALTNSRTYSDSSAYFVNELIRMEDSLRMKGYDFVDIHPIYYDGMYVDSDIYLLYRQQKTMVEYYILRELLEFNTEMYRQSLFSENNRAAFEFLIKENTSTLPMMSVVNMFARCACQDFWEMYDITQDTWLLDAMDYMVELYAMLVQPTGYYSYQFYALELLSMYTPYYDTKLRICNDIILPCLIGDNIQNNEFKAEIAEAYAYALAVVSDEKKDSIYFSEIEYLYKLSKSLPLYESLRTRYYLNLAYEQYGFWEEAVQIIQQDLKKTRKLPVEDRQYVHDGLLLELMGIYANHGQYDKLIGYLDEVMDPALLDDYQELQIFAYAYAGDKERLGNVLNGYIQNMQNAIQEDMFNFSGDKSSYLDDLVSQIQILFSAYPIVADDACRELLSEACYDLCLMTKSILLSVNSQIEQQFQNHPSELIRQQYANYLALKSQPADQMTEMERIVLEMNLRNINRTLYTELRKWNVTHPSAYTIYDWQDVRQSLGQDSVAIEFVQYKDLNQVVNYGALAMKRGMSAPMYLELGTDSMLLVAQGSKHISRIFEMTDLYTLVWSKLIDSLQIRPNDHIFFAADGQLYQIPIEYLPYNATQTIADVYDVHRVSSTRELCRVPSTTICSSADLFGGIQYGLSPEEMLEQSALAGRNRGWADNQVEELMGDSTRGHIAPLPGTLKEIQAIAPMFATSHTYSGIQASEEAFKALDGSCGEVLHIGTHGFFLSPSMAEQRTATNAGFLSAGAAQSPIDYSMSRTGLLLAGSRLAWEGKAHPAQCEDGILTAKEIANLDLNNVRLVVLSACETGLGDITNDGVAGLQRGFKKAGVQSILMSLWPVNDQATQMLMQEFYRQWTGGKSKHEALRRAQKKVRERYVESEYWAGFILLD